MRSEACAPRQLLRNAFAQVSTKKEVLLELNRCLYTSDDDVQRGMWIHQYIQVNCWLFGEA